MNYQEAKKLLKGRESKKIGNNTYLLDGGDVVNVCLHQTNVVRFYEDGRIQLNASRWYTVTTKNRMNKYLPHPWRVYQEKFIWYLWNGETKEKRSFKDGMFV